MRYSKQQRLIDFSAYQCSNARYKNEINFHQSTFYKEENSWEKNLDASGEFWIEIFACFTAQLLISASYETLKRPTS